MEFSWIIEVCALFELKITWPLCEKVSNLTNYIHKISGILKKSYMDAMETIDEQSKSGKL